MKKLKGLMVAVVVMALVIPVAFVITGCSRRNNAPPDGRFVLSAQGHEWANELLDVFLLLFAGEIGWVEGESWTTTQARDFYASWFMNWYDNMLAQDPTVFDTMDKLEIIQAYFATIDLANSWVGYVFPGFDDFVSNYTGNIDNFYDFFMGSLLDFMDKVHNPNGWVSRDATSIFNDFEWEMEQMENDNPLVFTGMNELEIIQYVVSSIWSGNLSWFEDPYPGLYNFIATYNGTVTVFEDFFTGSLLDFMIQARLQQENGPSIEITDPMEILSALFGAMELRVQSRNLIIEIDLAELGVEDETITLTLPFTMSGTRMVFDTDAIMEQIMGELEEEELLVTTMIEMSLNVMFEIIQFNWANNRMTMSFVITAQLWSNMVDMILDIMDDEDPEFLQDLPVDLTDFSLVALAVAGLQVMFGEDFPILARVEIQGTVLAPTGISLNILEFQRA